MIIPNTQPKTPKLCEINTKCAQVYIGDYFKYFLTGSLKFLYQYDGMYNV